MIIRLVGVGDPIQPDDDIPVWATGYEGYRVSVYIRPLDLVRGLRGVLVHLSSGGEHTWRGHYLFVALGKKLVLAWKAEEIGGDDSAVVDFEDIDGDGFPEMLYFWGALVGEIDPISNQTLGRVEAAVYRWNEESRKIEQRPLAQAGIPIFAVIGGIFDSADEAFDARKGPNGCQSWYYVLRTDPFPQLERGKYVIAKFTWRKSLAAAEHRACNASGKGFIAELIFFPEPFHRFSPTRPPQ